MIQVVKYLRFRGEEARKIVPEHLQHYLQSRILTASWHPEADYLELMRVVVQLLPRPDEANVDMYEYVARESSPSYLEGAYRALVRKGDPARTLISFNDFWRLRHDTGKAKVTVMGPTEALVELEGYMLVAKEACGLIQGSIWGLLHHSGAKGIEIHHVRCRARGAPVCEWRAKWRMDAEDLSENGV